MQHLVSFLFVHLLVFLFVRWLLMLLGKFRVLFSEFRSDWEWAVDTCRCRGYRHNFMCHKCFAHKDPCHAATFTDFTDAAVWLLTMWTHEAFWQSLAGVVPTVPMLMPGWRLERTLADSMHCVNLGICRVLIGSALHFHAIFKSYLVLDPLCEGAAKLDANATTDEVLGDLYVRFKYWCASHKFACSVNRFTQKNLHVDKVNKVPSFNCKASKSDKLVAFLADITHTYALRTKYKEAEVLAACLWGMAQYFHITKTSDLFF